MNVIKVATCLSASIFDSTMLELGLLACRIERLEIFDEFEEWHMIQVSGFVA